MTRLEVGERYERGGSSWEIAEVQVGGSWSATWVLMRALPAEPYAGAVSVLVRAVNLEQRFGQPV
jgi:hypothetical protein